LFFGHFFTFSGSTYFVRLGAAGVMVCDMWLDLPLYAMQRHCLGALADACSHGDPQLPAVGVVAAIGESESRESLDRQSLESEISCLWSAPSV
jgi:hypothetical protein